ncbi:LysR family transcriptional regulator [Cohnella abietis]|uniref:LysR family transcriptional regulator n=1 Tax=Cohnella abietis TaxID=2507935 RepID=A0A3T1DBS6_9BACL|nr:LysR family transcriptional regulator [Cohnella abietis]BBI35549.1 LysR family transcriptional regulator [Cohnella abietis]
MNIDHVEAFVYVIHYGSFNKAANVLYLSQPSVTARIQSLERELNCKLFDRVGKQVTLTEQGKKFLPYAEQLLRIYQKSKQQLQPNTLLMESINIGCTVSVANYVISDVLSRMQQEHPDVSFRIITGSTDEIMKKLLDRELDVGFVRNVTHPNIQSVKYYVDPIRLYVYDGHPFIDQEKVTVEAISEQPLVFFECGALDWKEIHHFFEKQEFAPNIQFFVDNLETAKKLILRKACIGFLPGMTVREEVAAGRLYEITIPEVAGTALQTNIVTLRGEQPALVAELVSIANRQF